MKRFGRITRVDVTGSTNDDMARMLGEEQARGLTLVADFQTGGSGRKGRAWIAPPGSSLLCTIALPDAIPAASLWAVPFWIALVAHAAIRGSGTDPVLQWPNDILIDGRKVAGILCISRVTGETAWAGCGIGINVQRPIGDETLTQIEPAPAFLSDFDSRAARDTLLASLLQEADEVYGLLRKPDAIIRAWEPLAQIPGIRYRIALDANPQPFDAIALKLLPGGSLLVDDNGAQREISLADARILR